MDGQMTGAVPLAVLGRQLAMAGDVLSAARAVIPLCQAAEPGQAARLQDLEGRLEVIGAALDLAIHPLLAERLAAARAAERAAP